MGNGGAPAKENAAEGTKGGASPTAAKAKNPGGKAGAQKRSKQKPEARKPAQGATAQPQKQRPAGPKPIDITCQPSDAAATIQLSPGAAPLQPLDSQHNRQASKSHAVEKATQNTEGQKAAERKEGSAKSKAAKRKAPKAPEPARVPQLTRLSSSSLSDRVSPLGPPSDRIVEDSIAQDRLAQETASQSGTEEAARSEPITQTATPVLTPSKPGMEAEPCASQPGLIRLGNSPMRAQGRADFITSKPPPLESLMPMAGPEQHHVKVCCALIFPLSIHLSLMKRFW